MIEARGESPADDMISSMTSAEIDGRRLSREEITSHISLLLVAGGETTDMALANLWYGLLTEPEALELVRADPALLDGAFGVLDALASVAIVSAKVMALTLLQLLGPR